jgi:hypothetical protein
MRSNISVKEAQEHISEVMKIMNSVLAKFKRLGFSRLELDYSFEIKKKSILIIFSKEISRLFLSFCKNNSEFCKKNRINISNGIVIVNYAYFTIINHLLDSIYKKEIEKMKEQDGKRISEEIKKISEEILKKIEVKDAKTTTKFLHKSNTISLKITFPRKKLSIEQTRKRWLEIVETDELGSELESIIRSFLQK